MINVLHNTALQLLQMPHRPSPLNALFIFFPPPRLLFFTPLKNKKSAYFSVLNLCYSWSVMLTELENQCSTHVNLRLLVLTRLNSSLATSPTIFAELGFFFPPRFSPTFVYIRKNKKTKKAFWLHWSGKLVGWMNWASAAGQKGNVCHPFKKKKKSCLASLQVFSLDLVV